MISLKTGNTGEFLDRDELAGTMSKAVEGLVSLNRREGEGAEKLGWLELPEASKRAVAGITDAAKRIQDENDCLVVVGIGGSSLGARAAIEALCGADSFPVLFAGNNLSPDYHARLIESLETSRFALCVISKSGTTTEPAVAFRILMKRFRERFGPEAVNRRIVAITDPARGSLRGVAERSGMTIFPIPPDVGGRFSVLSPVGLFPCAAAGINIMELMEGAASAMKRYTRVEAANDSLQYAARRTLLHEKGTQIEILSTFHPELCTFCEWWKQLAGESEGKDGKGLFPASAVMTADLHSLGQYLQEGGGRILETFLVGLHPRSDITVPNDAKDLDDLNYLAGRSLGEINRAAYEATFEAHAAGGRPVMAIEVPEIAAVSVGALFVFFEISVAVSGRLLGVNPFNQPGVEEYKRRMHRLLGKPGTA